MLACESSVKPVNYLSLSRKPLFHSRLALKAGATLLCYSLHPEVVLENVGGLFICCVHILVPP